jgi:hypothetical protein
MALHWRSTGTQSRLAHRLIWNRPRRRPLIWNRPRRRPLIWNRPRRRPLICRFRIPDPNQRQKWK